MSSTYVSGFHAAALRRASGYAYVMFFETCESNVFPRTPRWRPQYIGSLPEVLSQIVEYVDCCDGGMTKGARGRPISSNTFVRRCEQALSIANLVTDQRVTLEFGPAFRAIAPEKLAAFDAAAQDAGNLIHFAREGDPQGGTPAIRTVDLGTLRLWRWFSRSSARTRSRSGRSSRWGGRHGCPGTATGRHPRQHRASSIASARRPANTSARTASSSCGAPGREAPTSRRSTSSWMPSTRS